MQRVELRGLRLDHLPTERGAAQLDVLLAMMDAPEGMRGWFEYRTSLFSRELIGRWIRRFRVLLEGIVADPERSLDELDALLDAEARREQEDAQEALRTRRRALFRKR
jgi:non-ribosomal peptide synthetase component F